MAWRPMTAEEIATLPHARLGGSLLWIFVAAVALALVLPAGLAAIPALATGLVYGETGPWRTLLYWRGSIGVYFAIPWFFIMAWSLVFAVMTMMRLPWTPIVVVAGIAIWMILRIVLGFAAQSASLARYTGPASGVILSTWPIIVTTITDLILSIAFSAYMLEGARPNGYYRRRVRTGGSP